MTLQELASRYGFKITTLGSKSSSMSGRTGSLSFVHKTQQARINSTTVWLCSPVVPYRDRWGVSLTDVSKVLRSRFGTSGIEEKASRPPKQ